MDLARADALAARSHLAHQGWIARKAESFRHLPPPDAAQWLEETAPFDSTMPAVSLLMLWTLQNGAANFERAGEPIPDIAIGSRYRIRAGAYGSNQYCALDSFQTGPSAPFTSNKNADGFPGLRTNRITGTYSYFIVYGLGGPI